MPVDIFDNFAQAVRNAIMQMVRVGVVGRKNADDTTTITVEGRDHYIYVRTGPTQTGGEILEAYNKGIPRLAGAPVLLIKWNRVWTVIGVDADSPAVTSETYSVSYHRHLRDNGLAQSVNDLEGMPSTLAGRAGALLRVNDDEDGYYLADSASGGTGTVDSVNTFTGDVVLDADDIDDAATAHKFASAAELTKLAGIEAGADVTDAQNVGAAIAGAATDDTIVDADVFGYLTGGGLVKSAWSNIKATLKTYFDTLYVALTGDQTVAGVKTFSGGVTKFDAGAATNVYLQFLQNAVSKVIAGVAGSSGQLIADSVAGDFAIRTASQKILFSNDDGTTAHLTLSGVSTPELRLNSAAANSAFMRYAIGGTNKALIGVAGGAGSLIPGTVAGDLAIRVASGQRIFLSTDDGTTAHMILDDGSLYLHDGTSGKLFVTKTGVDGTAVTVIPDGTGDVTAGVYVSCVVKSSGGTTQAGAPAAAIVPGASVQIYANGGDIVTFAVAANGSVTVQRTGGALTYTVTLDLIWQ